MDIIVVRGAHKANVGKDFVAVNTTSQTKEEWSKGLSPFFVGPIPMWGGMVAQNLENAWQFTKVYEDQVDEKGEPSAAWWEWMRAGIANPKPIRFPRGRGAKPLYSYWNGRKMLYVEARHSIYAPLYAAAVQKTIAFKKLEKLCKETNGRLSLWDFDGYDHKSLGPRGITLEQVFYNTHMKMGHAFVLAMLLQNNKIWEQPYDEKKVWSSEGLKFRHIEEAF